MTMVPKPLLDLVKDYTSSKYQVIIINDTIGECKYFNSQEEMLTELINFMLKFFLIRISDSDSIKFKYSDKHHIIPMSKFNSLPFLQKFNICQELYDTQDEVVNYSKLTCNLTKIKNEAKQIYGIQFTLHHRFFKSCCCLGFDEKIFSEICLFSDLYRKSDIVSLHQKHKECSQLIMELVS